MRGRLRRVANKLVLKFRPGFGESIGTHATTNVAVGGAPANPYTAYEFSLGSSESVSSLVGKINSSSSASSSATNVSAHGAGAWAAQVGPGRSGTLTTDRFDFMINGGTELTTDLTNGGALAASTAVDTVDLLCDFNQQFF